MITVIGRDKSGKIVASEKCDTSSEAAQVAKEFKNSGLEVEQKREGNATPTE